jgi:hypothetical protein
MCQLNVHQRWVAALIASLFSTAIAQAGSVVQSRIMTVHSSPVAVGLSFEPFDNSLGELTGITISGQAMLSASVEVYNATDKSQRFDHAVAMFHLNLTEPDGLQTGVPIVSIASGVAAPGLGVFGKITNSQPLPTVKVPQAFWDSYEKTSVQKVSLVVSEGAGLFSGRAASGVFFGGIATAAACVTLRYDYAAAAASPVPLPAEALAACAMIAFYGAFRLIAARHRRRL